MLVIAPGTRVQVGEGADTFEAVVVAVCIEGVSRLTYRCQWWGGRDLKDMWLESCLVRVPVADYKPLRVGFGNEKGASEE